MPNLQTWRLENEKNEKKQAIFLIMDMWLIYIGYNNMGQ